MVNQKEKAQTLDALFGLISLMSTRKEIVGLLSGLLTKSELLMLGRRIQIVEFLIEGLTYEEISSKLRVGTQTIQRTSEWLYGKDAEYTKWLTGKIEKVNRIKNKRNQKFVSTGSLLDKYSNRRLI